MKTPNNTHTFGKILGALLLAAMLGFSLSLSAHNTKNERRTIASCNTLAKAGKRRACKKCVTKPRKHHYHPKMRKGNRCHKNGTQP